MPKGNNPRCRCPRSTLFLAVDIDFFVAFAEPERTPRPHGQHGSHVMAFAFGFQDQVVLALFDGILLPILGVEVGRIVGNRILFDPIDVVIQEPDFLFAFVGDFDANRLAEGHPPITIVRIGVLDHHRQADHRSAFAEAVGEEIAHRRLDGRAVGTVVINPQQHFLVVGSSLRRPILRLRSEERHPNVRDHAGALCIQEHVLVAGLHLEVVAVAPLGIRIAKGIGVGIVLAVRAHAKRRSRPHAPAFLRFRQTVHQGLGECGQRQAEE